MASEIKEINSKIKELKDILNGDNILTDDEIKDLEDKIENLKKRKLKIENKTPPKDENNKCTEKKIEECEKKGKVCNPLKATCVDKNGITYKNYLKTLKKTKTPPKDEIKELKYSLSLIKEDEELDVSKTPPKDILDISNSKCNKEQKKVCEKKGEICNYKTGRCISKTGITYKNLLKEYEKEKNNKSKQSPKTPPKDGIKEPKTPLKKELKKSIMEVALNNQECNKWFLDDTKNPRTNYLVDKDKSLYKLITKQCEKFKEKDEKKKENSLINDNINIIPTKPDIKNDEYLLENNLYYPDINDDKFRDKINSLYEFNIHKIDKIGKINSVDEFNLKTKNFCHEFEKTLYQHFVSHYISSRTPYNSFLLYHGVGVGKTCSAITLSENLLLNHTQNDEPKIWVVMPSALKGSFKEQIFSIANYDDYKLLVNQCTGDTYIKMLQLLKIENKEKALVKIKKFINTRYRLFTYDEFSKLIETEYSSKILKDKTIIIDEAHNIRNSTKNEDKRIYSALLSCLGKGINNRLILLSATPMYNEPTDIMDLLYLFLINDKREELLKDISQPFDNMFDKNNELNKKYEKIMKQLSSNYISYLKGNNPFTFATKLSPEDSGFKVLNKTIKYDPGGNEIPDSDNEWYKKINEGILLSKLSLKQKALIDGKKELNENNVLATLQPMNIVYDNKTGSGGFSNFFTRLDTGGSLKVNYNKKYENALYPSDDNLGLYSGKFLNIANIIKESKGIIIIYSRFVEGGILPLAIVLEHMGYNREGEKNILNNPKIMPNAPKYGYSKNPKYCIMTSHSDINNVMGNTSIDKLLPIINNKKNINGELLKVILMTPVASEGLSFYNSRELHIVEPWYHFNKSKQIIGRGIRNCRHNNLPLEERNMTVFMHASYDNYQQETPDIHAYRISSKKMYQTNVLDKIIVDNSLDCDLMKNINYFPKEIFNFNLKLVTSQNKIIKFNYGDSLENEPKCNIKKLKDNKLGFRKETYKHLVLNIINIIKKKVNEKLQKGERFITFIEIIKESSLDNNIIYEGIIQSIYPNTIIDNYILLANNQGIYIIDKQQKNIRKLNIVYNFEKPEEDDDINDKKSKENMLPDKLELNMTNKNINTILIYLSFDNNKYIKFVKYIIESDYNKLKDDEQYIADCLFNEGALINKKELATKKYNDKTKYIGYFDIFNEKSQDIILYDNDDNKYNTITTIDKDYITIISKRKEVEIPDMQKEKISIGLILPKQDKKGTKNQFKILTSGKAYGKKTGIVCESLLKPDQDIIVDEYKIILENDGKKITKEKKCKLIAENMMKINRLFMLPYYKPLV